MIATKQVQAGPAKKGQQGQAQGDRAEGGEDVVQDRESRLPSQAQERQKVCHAGEQGESSLKGDRQTEDGRQGGRERVVGWGVRTIVREAAEGTTNIDRWLEEMKKVAWLRHITHPSCCFRVCSPGVATDRCNPRPHPSHQGQGHPLACFLLLFLFSASLFAAGAHRGDVPRARAVSHGLGECALGQGLQGP